MASEMMENRKNPPTNGIPAKNKHESRSTSPFFLDWLAGVFVGGGTRAGRPRRPHPSLLP